jgi:hypothetical protein
MWYRAQQAGRGQLLDIKHLQACLEDTTRSNEGT